MKYILVAIVTGLIGFYAAYITYMPTPLVSFMTDCLDHRVNNIKVNNYTDDYDFHAECFADGYRVKARK